MGSANFNSRGGITPSLVILHYTGMESFEAARARLCDPEAEVSCHHLIGEDGRVEILVPETERAWHAGEGSWAGERYLNARSIGIELAHPGHGPDTPPYPAEQMASLEGLLAGILSRWPVPPEGVIGHSDVSPCRKRDPGEWFPWERLARAGLAVWCPPPRAAAGEGFEIRRLQHLLAEIGYDTPQSGWLDPASRAAIRAFARRFLPSALGRPLTAELVDHAAQVAARWPASPGSWKSSSP